MDESIQRELTYQDKQEDFALTPALPPIYYMISQKSTAIRLQERHQQARMVFNNIDPDGKVAITATVTFAGVSIAKALGGVATVGVAGYLWFSEPEVGAMNDALTAQNNMGNQPTDPNNGGRIVASTTAGAIVLNSTLSTTNPGQKQIKIRYEDDKTVVFTDANGVTRSVSREEFNKLYGRNATADSYNNKFNPCPDVGTGSTPYDKSTGN